jgi:hypothetical protein
LLEVINLPFSWLATVLRIEGHFKSTRLVNNCICCTILVAKCMSSNDNGISPSWYESWNVLNNNGLSEHCSVQLVTNGAIGRFPHLLELKLLDSCLIRCNSGTLYANFAFLNGSCCI